MQSARYTDRSFPKMPTADDAFKGLSVIPFELRLIVFDAIPNLRTFRAFFVATRVRSNASDDSYSRLRYAPCLSSNFLIRDCEST